MKFHRGFRLNDQADFRFVFERPQVTRDACFKVLSRANGRDYSRLGMAVSRKVCRRATGRNRLKRVIRESFRQHQREISGNGGWDIVVLPGARAATICNSELNGFLEAHWQKIKARPTASAGENERKQD